MSGADVGALVRREAVEKSVAERRAQRGLRAAARQVRCIPGIALTSAAAVVMPEHRPAVAEAGPSATRGIASVNKVPSELLPVRMSCRVGATCAPASVSAVSRVRFTSSLWRSSTLAAIWIPCALTHGPRPIRSRAWTAGASADGGALRYARHNRSPRPTAAARWRQSASAPARPPRLPPKPRPVLVMKNDIAGAIAGASWAAVGAEASHAMTMKG